MVLVSCGKNFNDFFAQGGGARRRSRFLRRKGRVRRLKYTWKSAGYQSFRKRISERKDQPCRQYSPCGCQTACGKTCPCLVNGTCCEKYCGLADCISCDSVLQHILLEHTFGVKLHIAHFYLVYYVSFTSCRPFDTF